MGGCGTSSFGMSLSGILCCANALTAPAARQSCFCTASALLRGAESRMQIEQLLFNITIPLILSLPKDTNIASPLPLP